MLRFVLSIILIQSVAWSQNYEGDILGAGTENSTGEQPANSANKKKEAESTQSKISTATKNTLSQTVKLDEYYNTWNARKLRQGFGFSPLLSLAQYDRWITPRWGFFIGVRYDKTQDNFAETKTTTYNQTSLSLTESVAFSGARNPTVLNLVVGAKKRIWQNDWMQVNWGPLLMYTHGTSVSYSTGTLTRTVANVNNPNDFTMSEASLGTISNGVDPKYSLGVKVGSEFYVKWFPNLALCADIVILNQLPVKGTQDEATATKTYAVVAGVQQAPTAESYSNVRRFNDFGGSASTSQVGSAYFNILGANWSIKYVW